MFPEEYICFWMRNYPIQTMFFENLDISNELMKQTYGIVLFKA